MSAADNTELVRRTNAAWNVDDWDELERLNDPDVEVVAPAGWPESGVFKGWPAVRRQYERLKESWIDEHAELLDIEAVGGHEALSGYQWTGQGKGSGLALDMRVWRLDEIRDCRVIRTRFFIDEVEARRAAGLEDGA